MKISFKKIKRRAVRALEKLPRHYRFRILEVLDKLRTNPIPFRDYNIKKLKGFDNTYRIRLGDIHVVYTVNWSSKTITVHFIGSREHAYKLYHILKHMRMNLKA